MLTNFGSAIEASPRKIARDLTGFLGHFLHASCIRKATSSSAWAAVNMRMIRGISGCKFVPDIFEVMQARHALYDLKTGPSGLQHLDGFRIETVRRWRTARAMSIGGAQRFR
jgi:hypothetical protein